MSGKHSRHTPSPSSPASTNTSKLPKFLQKTSGRDRSKSVNEPISGNGGSSSSSSPDPSTMPTLMQTPSRHSRKSNKFSTIAKDPESSLPVPEADDTPLVIEPISIPRPRTRSERPLSASSSEGMPMYSSPSHSTSRIGDLPTRLSGWFSHTFSTSSTDLTLPSILSQSHLHNPHSNSSSTASSSSPKGKTIGSAALIAAAKHGKGHLDKVARYILDSDSTPDKCTEPIWLLGVQHPGYEPPPPQPPSAFAAPTGGHNRRSSLDSKRRGSPPSFRSSTSSVSSNENYLSQSTSSAGKHPGAFWPPVFYDDFVSRVWLTYRSHFTPIKDGRLGDLCGTDASSSSSSHQTSPPPTLKKWNWTGLGGEKEWTTDSGWGCMLRTGQSLLANALVHHHLGREWRRPPYPVRTADYATYVEIVTWFLDTPAPEAPFSVHRMALAGKELGTDVGQWFGPSIAAGAIKTLLRSFPEAGLGVSVAVDGQLFQTDVFAASHTRRRHAKNHWGDRPVLLLLGIRLGLNGVNPIYHETIKALYTFPQSVGIAGGRPGSSYYFVGSQADNLFYLDPHHARPAVPLRPMEPNATSSHHRRAPTSPSSSTRTGSSTFSYHAPSSPSPLGPRRTNAMSDSELGFGFGYDGGVGEGEGEGEELDAMQEHYVTAYSASELKTFHCDRVRKMPLTGLDPSMLIGFLCRDEKDWEDFRRRVHDLPRTIFSVLNEQPQWSDDNMGLESMSDPDDPMDDDDEFSAGDGAEFFEPDDRSNSSTSQPNSRGSKGKSEADTEEDEDDPVDPVTPGPGSRFEFGEAEEFVEDDEIEDDWIETPVPPSPSPSPPVPVPPTEKSANGHKGKRGGKKQVPVPVPQVLIPEKEHYVFPILERSGDDSNQERTKGGKRMHTARARDGGRTQSGGVKGILTED